MAAGYSVKKNNLVVIWLDSEDTPGNLEQPTWPDGTAWASKKEAEDWAKAWLAHSADETAPRAGNGPDEPTIPVPTVKEVEAAREVAIAAAEKHIADAHAEETPIVGTDAEESPKAEVIVVPEPTEPAEPAAK